MKITDTFDKNTLLTINRDSGTVKNILQSDKKQLEEKSLNFVMSYKEHGHYADFVVKRHNGL